MSTKNNSGISAKNPEKPIRDNNFLSEVGKYFLDISKLTFGGLILSSIVGMNFDLENLMVYGIAASFFFALFGFTFIRVANEK
ncbi:MAG: DUF6722 family protein [Prevotella sp.]|nr:DUF6722 family protein [Prevotella sp.]